MIDYIWKTHSYLIAFKTITLVKSLIQSITQRVVKILNHPWRNTYSVAFLCFKKSNFSFLFTWHRLPSYCNVMVKKFAKFDICLSRHELLPLRVAQTPKNSGPLFLTCKTQQCRFFQWVKGQWTMVSMPTVHVGSSQQDYVNLNCTDNYDVAKIKVKSVTDHQ